MSDDADTLEARWARELAPTDGIAGIETRSRELDAEIKATLDLGDSNAETLREKLAGLRVSARMTWHDVTDLVRLCKTHGVVQARAVRPGPWLEVFESKDNVTRRARDLRDGTWEVEAYRKAGPVEIVGDGEMCKRFLFAGSQSWADDVRLDAFGSKLAEQVRAEGLSFEERHDLVLQDDAAPHG